MDQSGQQLLSGAALAGQEDRGVHAGYPYGQLEHVAHRPALGDRNARPLEALGQGLPSLGLLLLSGHRPSLLPEGLLQAGDLVLNGCRLEVLQVGLELRAPVGSPSAGGAAAALTRGTAGRFDEVDLFPQAGREVPAGVAGELPADRLRRGPEMAEVLLRLVAVLPLDLDLEPVVARKARHASLHRQSFSLERVQHGPGPAPLLQTIPLEEILHGLRVAVAVGVAEAGQESPCGLPPHRLDQLPAQDPQDVRVVEEHAAIVERDDPLAGPEVEKLEHFQFVGFHGLLPPPDLTSSNYDILTCLFQFEIVEEAPPNPARLATPCQRWGFCRTGRPGRPLAPSQSGRLRWGPRSWQ